MPKIDIDSLEWTTGSGYPAPFDQAVAGRWRKRLGNEAGLSQFGVNLTALKPGAQSALRHWHANEDEFVYVLQGELVLIEDDGETVLRPGDAAGFKSGTPNGHHLVNKSDADAVFLEVGTRAPDERAVYPDDDLLAVKRDGNLVFTGRDGSMKSKP